MFGKTLTLALAAATVFATSAQAAVIDTDSVKLTASKYDFGGSTLVAGAPTTSGKLEFKLSGGKLTPHLKGTLHLNDADGTCARMRLRYFDAQGDELTDDPKYGGKVCENDDRHHKYSVDLDPYRHRSIDTVEVALQRQTVSGWSTVSFGRYAANTHWDIVRITADGVDFGDRDFVFGAPPNGGWLDWGLAGAVARPSLTGYLHLNNSSGVCARVNLRYLSESGGFLKAKPGGSVCAADNGHQIAHVDLAPYESNKIGKVKVQLQTQANDGSWKVAGSKTVSIAE